MESPETGLKTARCTAVMSSSETPDIELTRGGAVSIREYEFIDRNSV